VFNRPSVLRASVVNPLFAGFMAMVPDAARRRDILVVRGLEVRYPAGRGRELTAVGGVSLRIARGETLALVGESGSGKSTIARAILRALRPSAGEVRLDLADGPEPRWADLARLEGERLRQARRRIQMVFQDPYASLDPRQTAGETIAEPMRIFRTRGRREIRERAGRLLDEVGLDPAFAGRYPHQFSGGQRQRIGIARALALDPAVLVLDEPVSALDVSVRAQVLNLLLDEKERRGLAYLFIAHDLGVVRRIAERAAVLYAGRIVEEGPVGEVYARPAHPYTKALLAAAPVPDPEVERARPRAALAGEPPPLADGRRGCPFSNRCSEVMDRCRNEEPTLKHMSAGRSAACLRIERP
jgi:oligopeptide/dipeptide ABC transporter ATP-binding protein